ncbi:MAG: hypothetical protein RML14_02395 [Meiothermus sp.]|uniref:hypothetical protein n=1 Tax=Meiothermus sp. TaxID=1955249 RepID=UPI00298F0D50|nr:hypothetical protein [Meiothermus sp.]MDW8480751.1 hypothetical protein [Meiothermus sp.]
MNLLRLLYPFWPQGLLALVLSTLPALAQAFLPGQVVKPLFDQVLAGGFAQLEPVLLVGLGLLGLLVLGGYLLEAFVGYLSVKIPAVWRERILTTCWGPTCGPCPPLRGGSLGGWWRT